MSKTRTEDNESIVFLSQSAKVFKIFGLWGDDKKLYTTKRTAIGPAIIFFFCFGLDLMTTSGYFDLKSKGNNDKSMMLFIAAFGIWICSFKMFAVWNSIHDIKQCIGLIQDIARKFENQQYIQKANKIYRVLFTVGSVFVNLALLLFFNIPTLERTRTLPFDFKNPVVIIDLMQSPFYELLYAYEVIGNFILLNVMMSCDTMFCGLQTIVSGILESINDVFVQAFIKDKASVPSEEEKLKTFSRVIEEFIEICRIIDVIKDIFNLISLTHFLLNIFMMAMALYVIFVTKTINMLTITMGACFAMQVFQLGLYCYFGEAVIQQIRKLRHSIYECDWYNQSKSFKIMVLLTLQRLENEPFITPGKVVPLYFGTFSEVMKTATSFFAFLYGVSNM